MHSVFIKKEWISDDAITVLDPRIVHHLRTVLRLKTHEKLIAVDEEGTRYECAFEEGASRLTLRIIKTLAPRRQSQLSLTIACAIPKAGGMDGIIDTLTQLGVARIVPLCTERTVVRIDCRKASLRVKRWQAIAEAASSQSQRSDIPPIAEVCSVKDALLRYQGNALTLISTLAGKRQTIASVVRQNPSREIMVFIGPEGDFSKKEVDIIAAAGGIPVTLGEQVLRVATAAAAVASFFLLDANG